MVLATKRLNPIYDVKLIESARSHFYTIGDDETWLPGVTTVLGAAIPKPALLPWALNTMGDNIRAYFKERDDKPFLSGEVESLIKESKNIYKERSAEAADLGSRVHAAIDDLIRGHEPTITDDIRSGVDGFLQWKESHKLTIELGDTKLASRLFGYGGSLDFVAFDGDKPIIFDVKTTRKRKDRSHGVYDEYGLQLAAYCQAFQETYGLKAESAYVLWVNKEKPEFKAVKVTNVPLCFDGFLAALKLYQIQKFEKFEDAL